MTRTLASHGSKVRRLRSLALAVAGMALLSSCQSPGNSSGQGAPATPTTVAAFDSAYPDQGVIVSADGLYQLMPDFHCRDDGPDSEDSRCLTLSCPATASSAREGRTVIWKRAPRAIANPGWHDWVPVGPPTCFYDPAA